MYHSYISIDVETTGLNPKTDKIIEIGAVKVRRGEEVQVWQSLIRPGRSLPPAIRELTGITDQELEEAPPVREVMESLLDFMEDYPLLGHSVLFDYSFLKKAAVNQGASFEKEGIDTLKIARKYLADLEHRSLGYLCGRYEIPHKAHRALEDARATHLLYGRLCREFEKEGEEGLFAPSPLRFEVKKEAPATPGQKERLRAMIRLCAGMEPRGGRKRPEGAISRGDLPDLSVDVESLTRNEASRLGDRLTYCYGVRCSR